MKYTMGDFAAQMGNALSRLFPAATHLTCYTHFKIQGFKGGVAKKFVDPQNIPRVKILVENLRNITNQAAFTASKAKPKSVALIIHFASMFRNATYFRGGWCQL
jgi:hypothetical protein